LPDRRLAVTRNGVSLIDELAAVSKKLELERAVMFPRPAAIDDCRCQSVCRSSWIADSIGVPPKICCRFQQAVRRRYLGSK